MEEAKRGRSVDIILSPYPLSRLRRFPLERERQWEIFGKLALTKKGKVQIQKNYGIEIIKIIENLKIL